jgi:micrococcal nuclease
MHQKVKRLLWILLAILLSAVLVIYRGNFIAAKNVHARVSAADFSSTTAYRVLSVVDGDTIDVDVYGEKVRIRLLGINTPETVDPRKPVECFGKEASARAKTLLSETSVEIETDKTQGLFDKYGRVLAYIYLSDGTSFNKEMISEGYAHEYTYRYPYRYQNEFKEAERGAREARAGLWAPRACNIK